MSQNMATNTLAYSDSALGVKSAFYNKKAMVYVEGTDDIIFWEQFFDKHVYKVEDVGGCGNFKEYIQRLNNGEKSFVVAGDLDYSPYMPSSCSSKLFVTTYSHSIENVMYCPHNINHAVQRLARDSRIDSLGEIESFYERFINGVEKLLILDTANNIYSKGIRIFGESCHRFLDQSNLPEINQRLVDDFYNAKVVHFDEQEIRNVERLIQSEQRPKRLLVKGHFLTEAIRLWINKRVPSVSTKNPQLNGDALYEALVTCHDICTPICKERGYILHQIEEVEKVIEFTII